MKHTDAGGLREARFRVPRRNGLHLIQERGHAHARELSSRRLILDAGERHELRVCGEESVLVLQQGSARVLLDGQQYELSRKSVFEERAWAVYLPSGAAAVVCAETALEAIVVSTPSAAAGDAHVVSPVDVRVLQRGGPGHAREVHEILVGDPYARRLMVGETFSPSGSWSSFPPHKHDGLDGEPRLEEVYHFRVDLPGGFGIQRLYTSAGEDVSLTVEDGDAVLIPYGYHPVAVAPGYRLYYLWALAGDERRLALYEDPRHRWIHGTKSP